MIIYRVELPDGTGAYQCERCFYEQVHHRKTIDRQHLPVPDDDHIPRSELGRLFGFGSFEQFCAWFERPAREYLAAMGCRLSLYEVPLGRACVWAHQATFDGMYARLLRRESLI